MSFDNTALGRVAEVIERVSTLVALAWPTADRAAVQSEDVVAPGQLGTFRFSVRAPLKPGVYKLPLRPVVDGTVWMEDEGVFILVTSLADYRGRWVSQSDYPTVRMGGLSAPITMSFRNTGSQAWVKGTLGQQVNLGISDDASAWSGFASTWPATEPRRDSGRAECPTRTDRDVHVPGTGASATGHIRPPPAPGHRRNDVARGPGSLRQDHSRSVTSRAAGSRTFRTHADRTRRDSAARGELVRQICAAALLLGGGVHIAVGLEHAGSNFGTLSLIAGLLQETLGALVFLRAADVILRAVVVLSGVLIQLYLLSVTTGLPPTIAHIHVGGNHQVWLFTLARPGSLDPQGVLVVATEIAAIACAMWLAGRSAR